MFSITLYVAAFLLLGLSFARDRAKTRLALKRGWKSFERMMPQFLALLVLIGMALAVVNEDVISRLLGVSSGIRGMALAALIGSVTLIPGFVAFPLAASLIASGAGYAQTAMFLTTLMMVGVVTLPLEMQCLGRRLAVLRNLYALVYAVVSSFLLGALL